MVLSTLHTNSAIGAISRLRDLGVRPFLIADSLVGVLSQRLVRKVCNACKEPYSPPEFEKEYLKDPTIETLYRGKGCEVCNNTGYLGRTLVYELLTVNRELSTLIEKEADPSLISERAASSGHINMLDIMTEKVKQGITTYEEAVRILGSIRHK